MATTTEATMLSIKSIIADPEIQIRRGEHRPTVQRYEESLDELPPILVIATTEGHLLADGFHRLAGFRRGGREEIPAILRSGTRQDAEELAVTENAKNADPLTPEERDDGIRRLKALHPDWTLRDMAAAMSVSKDTVDRVLKASAVRDSTPASTPAVSDSVLAQIARAEPEVQQSLADAAARREWSAGDTREAVELITSPETPGQIREGLLAGEIDPTDYDADHGERLRIVQAEVVIRYRVPSSRTRQRAGRTYSREDETIERRVKLTHNSEVLDDPDPKRGLVTLSNAIAKAVYRQLLVEGYPIPNPR